MRGLKFKDIVRYVFLIALWPIPIGTVVTAYAAESKGNKELAARSNTFFEGLVPLRNRISSATLVNPYNLPSPTGSMNQDRSNRIPGLEVFGSDGAKTSDDGKYGSPGDMYDGPATAED